MLKLRPHHILDIVRNIGNERPIIPHEYGHLVHTLTQKILEDINRECILVVKNDDICGPCKMLTSDNRCMDMLRQLNPPIPKQTYNDILDKKLLHFLCIKENSKITIKDYLLLIKRNLTEIMPLCTHPKEDSEYRKSGLINGLKKLGL